MFVRELTDGCDVDQVFLVRSVEVRARRDGAQYLRAQLADRTGSLAAVAWDGVDAIAAVLTTGAPAHVCGRFSVHPKYGAQLALRSCRAPEPGSFELADLLDGPPRPVELMEADLRELVATVRQPHLRQLLERLLGAGSPTWTQYRDAPAAKHYHQAYRHGLLEHSLTVAQSVSTVSAIFPGIDRDVAVTGALLHDIGKLEAYSADPLAIDLTDAGRLEGEIPLGYYRIRREIEDIEGFPPGVAQALLHIILSHHGSLEHGSPVVPCTREATLVHFIDNLGGRLGSFDRLQKELADGATWSGYDRALGGAAHFRAAEDSAAAQAA